MLNASLGKVMISPIYMNIVVYSCFVNVWTVLININGKFSEYIGNVICTYL